ncbi:hypothetical protein GGS21DRAFT_487593 [Xylaria nigripes]|nr:hypothetical protein GGS21DRAFT_487593 [Xylaria nigripes]
MQNCHTQVSTPEGNTTSATPDKEISKLSQLLQERLSFDEQEVTTLAATMTVENPDVEATASGATATTTGPTVVTTPTATMTSARVGTGHPPLQARDPMVDRGPQSVSQNQGVGLTLDVVPDLSSCGHFDGSESAARWLSQLHWQFRRVGYKDSNLPPSEAISSINMLCTKAAATFLDSDVNLQSIIERAAVDVATREDLRVLEQALKDRYPVRPVDHQSFSTTDDLTRLCQNKDEPLAQYFARIQNSLRQAGGRDRPHPDRSQTATALTPSELTLLRTVVSRFVDGLTDFRLKQEALSHRARHAASLSQCYEIILESQRVLEDKDRAANEEEQRMEMDALRQALTDHRGLTVEEAIVRYHPQVAARYTQPGSLASPNPALQPLLPMTTQAPSAAPQLPAPPLQQSRLAQVTCYTCNQQGHYSTTCPYGRPGRNLGTMVPASLPKIPNSTPLPPRDTSKHPLVNGSELLGPGEKACFRCGSRKHLQTKCDAAQTDWLAWWEQAHLKAMIFPAARYRNTSLPLHEVQSRSAQLFYEQFLDDDELQSRDLLTGTEDDACVLASNSVTVAAVTESGCGKDAPATSDTDDPPTNLLTELETQILVLQSLLASAAADVGHVGKKRRAGDTSIPISTLMDDTLLPEQNDTTRTAKPRKNSKTEARHADPKPLTEIRGRRGRGPLDYRRLLDSTTVEISLMDLLQLSPDFSRNLKHLSVKASEKVDKTFRRYAKMKETTSTLHTSSTSVIQPTKAYRITPTLKFVQNGVAVNWPVATHSCQADQGSDVNIIHPKLVDDAGLRRLKIRDLGIDRLLLLNSSGKTDPVSEFVVFVATVESISRSVWAIVQPDGGKISTLLILGLPWLWDVMATFDIRDSVLTIGDTTAREPRVQIHGPTLSFTGKHRLALAPATDTEPSSSSGESDSDTTSSSSESGN